MKNRNDAVKIFSAGVESVKPENLISRRISLHENILGIDNRTFDISGVENIYVIGVGKASASMALAMESILGSKITTGHIVTKYGHSAPLRFIKITEAGHPVPDENGLRGTESILSIVNPAGENDLVICLISGGGSALLADVPERCTLDDLKVLNGILLKTGADITEMNCIRKHLSKVKGGLLAKAAYPAQLISLILSDVIGDPLDAIASGPTVPDPTTFEDALRIIDKYGIRNEIPENLLSIILEGVDGKRPETLKESDHCFEKTDNIIIGNNLFALDNARIQAEALGYKTTIVTNKLDGDISSVTDYLHSFINTEKKKTGNGQVCLLFGGEPTVKIKGNGQGGRNQHLALLIAGLIKDISGVTFLSGGTDGTDGPTDAAGAVVDSRTCQRASDLNLDCRKYTEDFDSYNFFRQEGGLITTGPTQTNVMDMMILLFEN